MGCGAHAGWDWTHFTVSCINFAIFLAILIYFTKGPINQFFALRRTDLIKSIEEAKELRDEAQRRLDEYTEKMNAFDAERSALIDAYRQQGERERDKLFESAKQRVEKMQSDAEHLLEQEVRHAVGQMEERAIDLAVALATEIVTEKLDQPGRKRLVDQYVADMGEMGVHEG